MNSAHEDRHAWRHGAAAMLWLLIASVTPTQAAYTVDWWTVDGGGEMFSTGGGYSLAGTIGQPDASRLPMSGGSYSVSGGFWARAGVACTSFAKGDFDQDCDVDGDDFELFKSCAVGADLPYSGGCDAKDLDGDSDVDMDDFGAFQRCWSGAGQPADPNCG